MANKKKPEAEAPGGEPAVDLLGQLTIELDGTEYTLRPDRLAISAIEKQLGMALPQLAVQCGSLGISTDQLGVCVTELMRAVARHDRDAGPDYKGAKPERVADLIYEADSVQIMRRLANIFVGAMTGGYTASGEVKAAGPTTRATPTAD